MSYKIEESFQSPDLKKLELEIQDWIIDNASIIIKWFYDDATSTESEEESEESEEDPLIEFIDKTKEIKMKIKNLVSKESSEIIPLIFHRLIITYLRLLGDPKIKNSKFLNSITLFYLSIIYELKKNDPDAYSRLEPEDQFSPDTFYYICNELSKDNDLVEIIDEEFWKDEIFKKITNKKENKLLKHSVRSLIVYSNCIQNRKERLRNLK